MAEQVGKTEALVPVEGEYIIEARSFDGAGKVTSLKAHMPSTSEFAAWSLNQQVVMLKNGMWKTSSVPDIVWGLAYGRALEADPMKGEIFPTGAGRWGTSNKYKIRKALDTGNVVGIEVEMKDTGEAITLKGCPQKTDLECTAKIYVKGWKVPITRRARLSRWFKESNPNWQGNPEHMLELNTIAHACEYVPGGPQITEDDEAPPLPPAPPAPGTLVET